nr:MAG TPA: hypothetical protein [Caudoviricetes sp.]
MHEKSRYGTSERMFCAGFLCYTKLIIQHLTPFRQHAKII